MGFYGIGLYRYVWFVWGYIMYGSKGSGDMSSARRILVRYMSCSLELHGAV